MVEHPLDERKQRILRQIVEAYIRYGEPVGSKVVAEACGLGVSSATVRNEMGILEREGYITQPHTSAGRIPTEKAYRYYVDELAPRMDTDPQRSREIDRSLTGALSAIDDLLKRASLVLSELTSYTSLAAAPPVAEGRVRHLQLIPLGARKVLLVLVAEGAWHEERVLELDHDPDEDLLRRAVERTNRIAAGKTITEAAAAIEHGAEPEWTVLGRAVARALRAIGRTPGRVFAGGTSRLVVWEPGPTAARVLELLEEGEMEPLLPEPRPEHVDVRIGHELAQDDLRELSLIAAGYRLGRRGTGTLGVLGPMRMDYPAVISTVAAVARSLSRVLRRFEAS